MRTLFVFAFAPLLLLSLAAQADTLSMPSGDAVTPVNLPRKGETMNAVVKQFGAPKLKHAAAGGDAPKHPPITRWDYDGFSVFFEHTHVVDAVVPGSPPPVFHTDQLQSAAR